MKQRFSSLDVRVVAHELAEALVSLRLANIYDLNSKILLLKFAKPNSKQQILIESGFRCHLTDFARTTAPAPSNFVVRLRKFLKTRRVTSVSQIGTDRIIEFQFSDGAYRLYLEFFASGNIILTDSSLTILTLLRNVPEGEGQEPQRVGLTYTLENRQNYGGIPPLTTERLHDALKTAVEQSAVKKTKKKAADELRRALATTITELPPILVEHIFRLMEFDPATKPSEILENESLEGALLKALKKARAILDEITSSPTAKGYIIAKRNPRLAEPTGGENDGRAAKAMGLLYEDFQPFLPKQFEDDPSCEVLSFDGFNRTVDEFFSSLEGQRLESRLQEREEAAKKKLEAVKDIQAKRIEGLQEVQDLNLRKAAAIQANLERVQEAMDAVNGLLQQAMDWEDINKLVEREQRMHNPVAEIIKLPMKLSESTVTLWLGEGEEEDEADEELDFDYETDDEVTDAPEADKAKSAEKRLAIDINLKISPWNNAKEYYEQKRSAAGKEKKTVLQSAMALKNAEQKIAEDLKKGLKQEKPVLQPIRKQMWFEKFTWFISSDGYLVLGGRDAQQNEMLYKRYLRKGDIYVHADLHGASSVIIKNNPKTPDAPIPPSTLAQAGNLSVCCSSAWDSKAGMGAWWVNADQVSKTAPAGEYLPVGSFLVRGKRNLLPPALLMLGFGLLFRISDQSKGRHVKHRLYDTEEANISTTGTATLTSVAEGSSHQDENADDSVSEEEDEDRANPLQPNMGSRDPNVQEEDVEDFEVPTQKLADIDLSQEAAEPTVEDKPEQAPEEHEGESEDEDGPQPSSSTADPPSRSGTPASQSAPKKAPLKRGQRNKAKKIAAKYKDQDEEDRELMEELLGVKAARQKAEAEAAARAQKEAEAAAAQERRRLAQERAKKQIAEHEEIRRMMLEEGVDVLDDGEEMEATPLDALVGVPLPGDEILEVIPMCAPWGALGKVKYKAKLQPGNTKKGKAVKEIVERWRLAAGKKGVVDDSAADPEKMWPREVELIKGMKVEEAFNCVPVGKVTVMMSGSNAGGGGGSSKGGQKKGGGRGGKGSKR
ncbi:fibronectin-binding protein A N-terminus-domain-containing protein [Podospora aff. communis PSN243]|uniref:Ribosome quality control complex subunit 2 n=1 Tax=Podospora aff. communis PSN243 TaxID=3040156 RepID=A0AAV9GZD1_9PEZI|nr:fibronectin-binding protein A N-terminus-domain-containing protein [Podospora aff. communis PSN243]